MGTRQEIYMGVYFTVKPFIIQREKTVVACINNICYRYQSNTKNKFCKDCGSMIEEMTVVEQCESTNIVQILEQVCSDDEYAEFEDFMFSAHDVSNNYILNRYSYFDADDMDCLDLTTLNSQLILDEERINTPQIDRVMSIINEELGDIYITVSFGLVTRWT